MADKEKKDDQDAAPKGNKMKMIIIAAVAVVLIIGVGVGAYFLGAASSKPQDMSITNPQGEPAPAAQPPAPPSAIAKVAPHAMVGGPIGPMVEVDNFIVNLLDLDTTRYLKAKISLEVDKAEAAEEVQARMSQIRDAILLLAGNKTYAELRDLQGKMQLRAELLGHINTLLETGHVKKIYFTNFVIQ